MDAVLFVGTVIAGLTEFVKAVSPKVQGSVTVAVAVLVGVLVALVDTQVGINDITVAQGIVIALGTVGVVGTAKKIG